MYLLPLGLLCSQTAAEEAISCQGVAVKTKLAPALMKTENMSSLTVQASSDSDQDNRHTPVPQERAESRGVAVPDLLEGQLVSD